MKLRAAREELRRIEMHKREMPMNDRSGSMDGSDTTLVREVLRRTGLAGATAAQIGAAANVPRPRVSAALDELAGDGSAIVLSKPHGYLDGEVGADLLERVVERLDRYHRERPWALGLTSLGLAHALAAPEPVLVRVLAAYLDAGCLAYRSGYYAMLDFRPQLTSEQRAFFNAVFGAQTDDVGAPVATDRLRALMKTSTAAELAPALETLFAGEILIQIRDWVYWGSHVRAIRARLEAALQRNGQITVAEFRDLASTSRKYAVPLLEFFDAAGVTVRRGDIRVLRT